MHRLAVFVEGYTELLFVDRLIMEIAGAHKVVIEHREIRGGGKAKRRMSVIRAARQVTDEQYYVLIVDCGGDTSVKSKIQDEHENLSRIGYAKIIGLRDVRPDFTYEQIDRLESALGKYIKTSLIPVEFVLAIMEVEAWFLAEFNHFQKIDPAITVSVIKARLGFDPTVDDMALRDHPAGDLNQCYVIGGKNYDKSQGAITATVDALDYPYIYLELAARIPYLKRLVDSIERFLV